MKQIPFKCRFGHIIVKTFQDNEEKPSEVICKQCYNTSNNEFIFDYRRNGKNYSLHHSYAWFGKKEVASNREVIARRF